MVFFAEHNQCERVISQISVSYSSITEFILVGFSPLCVNAEYCISDMCFCLFFYLYVISAFSAFREETYSLHMIIAPTIWSEIRTFVIL